MSKSDELELVQERLALTERWLKEHDVAIALATELKARTEAERQRWLTKIEILESEILGMVDNCHLA